MYNSGNKGKNRFVLFNIEEIQYALYLYSVIKVIRSVNITPLPKAPDVVMGIINFHGEIIPVIDIRKLFNLPLKEIGLEDRFIIVKTSYRTIALFVDTVEEVLEVKEDNIKDIEELLPSADYLSGVAKIRNNIILISDIEKLLSINEQQSIDNALQKLNYETEHFK